MPRYQFAVIVVTTTETFVIWEDSRETAEVTYDVAKRDALDVMLVEVVRTTAYTRSRAPEQLRLPGM